MPRGTKPKRRSLNFSASRTYALKKTITENSKNFEQSLLYDFYTVRRSSRVAEKEEKTKQRDEVGCKVRDQLEEGLEAKPSPGKGRGVFTTRKFLEGEYVCEYAGDLVDYKTALSREKKYEKRGNPDSYMYFFTHKQKKMCVDATAESGRFGRLINHSRLKFNLKCKVVEVDSQPHIIFLCCKDVDVGEELLYDYGDRSRQSLINHPWLRY